MEHKGEHSCCDHHAHAPKPPETLENPNAIYTCPMHPEVRQVGPGDCPICGMALEPIDPFTAVPEKNPELEKMKKRLWWALALTVPEFLLGMMHLSPWIQLILTTPVVLWAGWPFHRLAWQSLKQKSPNMFTLISIGTLAAYGYSVIAVVFPGIFPESMQDASGFVGVYFETAAVITTLVLLGQVLELLAREKTGESVRALLDLKPKTAILFIDNDLESEIPVDKVEVGQILRIRPGTRIPADGIVTYGSSFVDESMLTGEPNPVAKGIGSRVIGGTLNKNGSFLMRTEKTGRETVLAQIVQMVSDAQRTKAPIQNLADVVSRFFVPIVVLVAASTFAVWFFWGPEPRLAYALVGAVSVLIIACPCALGLATPMSVTVGVGRGARSGILIRNASAIEKLQKVDTLLVDKTGTLTEGRPRVVSIVPLAEMSEETLLFYAGTLEKSSQHPLAQAILMEAKARGIPLDKEPENFHSITGSGVSGKVDGDECFVGNSRFLQEAGVNLSAAEPHRKLAEQGETLLFMAVNKCLVGIFGVKDPIKSSSRVAVQSLRQAGISVVLVTGDSTATAHIVAKELGIKHVYAEVMPEQKLELVKKLQQEKLSVAMAGDGINDAPALAQADVGIAMGTGTDVAIESAGVVLVKGDLNSIVHAMALSRATMRNIRQNLFFAFAYNFLGIPLAAGVLFPWYGILLSPMVASLAMSLSSVSVIANSLRLRRLRISV